MTITSVGSGAYASHAAGTLLVPMPAGWVDGDLGILHLYQRDTTTAVTTPTGWTLIAQTTHTSPSQAIHAYYRVLVAGDASTVSVTVPASTKIMGAISAWRGVDTGTPMDVAASTGNEAASVATSTRTVAPPTATVTNNALAMSLIGGNMVLSGYTTVSGSVTQAYGGTSYLDTTNNMAISSGWLIEPTPATSDVTFSHPALVPSLWVSLGLRPASDVAPAAADLADLCATPAPRDVGVLMSANDPYQGKLSVQIATPYTDDGGVWDVSFWDSASWAGYQWNDLSARVRGLSWTRGAEQPGGRPAVGTATVTLDNRDGDASPWSTAAGDFVVGGVSWLRAGILVRFGVNQIDPITSAETYLPFFTGLIESMEESTADNVDGWVELALAETLSALALYQTPAVSVVGAGEDFADRVTRLLSDANWLYATDTTLAAAADYSAVFNATALDGNRLAEVYLTGDSINARILSGSNGGLLATPPTPSSSSAYTFSNAPSGGQLPIVTVQPYVSTDRILNSVSATRVGGTTQTVSSSTSIDQFGYITTGLGFPREDLIVTDDAVVLAVITDVLARTQLDDIGIESFEFDADMDPTTMFAALTDLANEGVDLRMVITVAWEHPSGQTLTKDLLVDAMTHGIVMEGNQAKWTGTFSTAAATPRTS